MTFLTNRAPGGTFRVLGKCFPGGQVMKNAWVGCGGRLNRQMLNVSPGALSGPPAEHFRSLGAENGVRADGGTFASHRAPGGTF